MSLFLSHNCSIELWLPIGRIFGSCFCFWNDLKRNFLFSLLFFLGDDLGWLGRYILRLIESFNRSLMFDLAVECLEDILGLCRHVIILFISV